MTIPLPTPVLVYLAIGLSLLALIVWRTPEAVGWPTGGSLARVCWLAGFVAAFMLFWPWPLAVAVRQAFRILAAHVRAARG